MYVDSELKRAQLEMISGASSTPAARARLYANIADTSNVIPMFHDGLQWGPLEKRRRTSRTVTTTATLAASDWLLFCDATAGAFTTTLMAAAGVTGQTFRIQKTDSTFSAVTLDGDGAELIEGAATVKLCTRGEWVLLYSTGTAWTIVGHGYYEGKTAWTPTGAWSANTTYTAYWWRIDNQFYAEILVAVTGAPTSASLTITLPVTIDTAQMAKVEAAISALPGRVQIRDAGTDIFSGYILYSSTTAIAIFKDDGDGTQSTVTQAAPMTFATGDYVHVFLQGVPVTDWIAAA